MPVGDRGVSSGQPAVSTAMTATTITSQRNLSFVALTVGLWAVSSAATKQLTQAVGAAAEEGDDKRGRSNDDDGHRDQSQAAR